MIYSRLSSLIRKKKVTQCLYIVSYKDIKYMRNTFELNNGRQVLLSCFGGEEGVKTKVCAKKTFCFIPIDLNSVSGEQRLTVEKL